MTLDKNLIKEFVEATNDTKSETKTTYLRGTIVTSGGSKYVQLDGSSTATPISGVVDVDDGDRVLVSIENHQATIIGNFTFPPSARKEQEAIDNAQNAQDTADSANTAANAAQEAAQSASTKADEAIDQSSIASASAAEAKEQAAEAIDAANAAQESITETKELATQANTAATEAKQQAADSLAASANAQAKVTELQNEVDTAKEDVASALETLETQADEIEAVKTTYATKVEVGNTKAELETTISTKVGELETTISETYSTKSENVELEGRLQSQITQNADSITSQVNKIEELEADTTQAQEDVAEALTKADAAQSAANTAQAAANAAQTTADEAAASAATASEKATIAQNAADAAQAAADAADTAVQTAQSDLNEAKKNLENVTSRVDATEADIADAQAKVDAAQTSVNEALADAAEANLAATKAQEAADQAQADAETAQGLANTAQQKADNAQTAADKAQSAADQANADVAALTSRVTTAETTISQNSEAITLNATKTEEIGEKLDNLQIGGRNLLLNTAESKTVTGTGGSNQAKIVYYFSDYYKDNYYKYTVTEGESLEVTISFDWSTTASSGNVRIQLNSWPYTILCPNIVISENNKSGHIKGTAVITKRADYVTNYTSVIVRLDNLTGSVTLSNVKLEIGNKATDWTPAPEDIENNLANNYYTKTETDAQIKVESDKITSTVTTIQTTLSELGSTDIVEDTPDIMVDASANPASLTVYGNSYQETSVTNRNELDLTRLELYNTPSGLTINSIEANKLNISVATGTGTWQRQAFTLDFLEPNTTYTYSVKVSGDSEKPPDNTHNRYAIVGMHKISKTGGDTVKSEMSIYNADTVYSKQFTTGDDFDEYQYTLLFFCTMSEAATADTTVYFEDLYIAKEDSFSEYIEFTPDMPSPDYPSEIETVDGIKNYFDLNMYDAYADTRNNRTLIDNGIRLTCKTAGTYRYSQIPIPNSDKLLGKTIVCKADVYRSANQTTQLTLYWLDENYVMISTAVDNTVGAFAQDSFIIEVTLPDEYPEGATGLGLVLYSGVSSTAIGDYCDWTNIQIDEGSVASHLHPYVPLGSYGVVMSTGKNWLHPITYYKLTNNSSGTHEKVDNYVKVTPIANQYSGIYLSSHHNRYYNNESSSYIKYLQNKLLNINKKITFSFYAKADSDRTITVQGLNAPSNSLVSLTTEWQRYNFTYIPNTSSTVTFYSGTSLSTVPFYIKDIQLEIGSEVTELEPHEETTTLIDMNTYDEDGNITGNYELCKIGDIKDELTIVDGKVQITKRIGKVILDGSESWAMYSSTSSGRNSGFYISVSTNTRNAISDYYAYSSLDDPWGASSGQFSISSLFNMCFVNLDIETLDDWKTWLSENNVTVYYQAAEPETIILEGDYSLQTFKGINHVFIEDDLDPSNMSLEYYPNTSYNDTLVNEDTLNNSVNNLESDINNRLGEVNVTIETIQSTITQLSSMIASMVTDANGTSLMTQTSDGWTFNMSSITSNLEAVQDALEDMAGNQTDTNNLIDSLTNLVNDVVNKTAYIVMSTDDNGDPCIELGKSDNPFKVRITNTAIDFMEGSSKIAYANNNTFYTEKLIVKNELQIGEGPGFIWRTRSNGNMGIVYIPGPDEMDYSLWNMLFKIKSFDGNAVINNNPELVITGSTNKVYINLPEESAAYTNHRSSPLAFKISAGGECNIRIDYELTNLSSCEFGFTNGNTQLRYYTVTTSTGYARLLYSNTGTSAQQVYSLYVYPGDLIDSTTPFTIKMKITELTIT